MNDQPENVLPAAKLAVPILTHYPQDVLQDVGAIMSREQTNYRSKRARCGAVTATAEQLKIAKEIAERDGRAAGNRYLRTQRAAMLRNIGREPSRNSIIVQLLRAGIRAYHAKGT